MGSNTFWSRKNGDITSYIGQWRWEKLDRADRLPDEKSQKKNVRN